MLNTLVKQGLVNVGTKAMVNAVDSGLRKGAKIPNTFSGKNSKMKCLDPGKIARHTCKGISKIDREYHVVKQTADITMQLAVNMLPL